MAIRLIRKIFKILNALFMVPLFRLGLGAFVGNPITGYIMLLKTVGHKTGKARRVPVNYAILDGAVYCLAGFGKDTHWYRNIQAQPNIELILPSGPVAGVAEDVIDLNEALPVYRQILVNSGFAAFLAGINPYAISDTDLRKKVTDYSLIRIRSTGVGTGAADKGGWLWILTLLATGLVLWFFLR